MCDDNSLDLSLGQLEETISKVFVKSANLRGLLIKEGCPTAIKHCTSHFSKLTDPEIRNSMLLDISTFLADPENEPFVDEIPQIAIAQMTHAAICTYFHSDAPWTMKLLSFFTINGLTYSTVKRHQGNSSVIVHHPSQPLPRSKISLRFRMRLYLLFDSIENPLFMIHSNNILSCMHLFGNQTSGNLRLLNPLMSFHISPVCLLARAVMNILPLFHCRGYVNIFNIHFLVLMLL